jgi:ankyrin repeat protein
VKAGASVHSTDKNNYTALNWCARKNQNGFAKELIAAGADINHQDGNTQYSPLMWGVIKGHLGIVVTFIKAGADLNLQDRVSLLYYLNQDQYKVSFFPPLKYYNSVIQTGTTAIMHAASEGHFDIVKALRNSGAELYTKNKVSLVVL